MLLLQKVRAARMRTAQGYCTQRAGTLYKALSLLYRSRDLQPDIRWNERAVCVEKGTGKGGVWKALDEISQICIWCVLHLVRGYIAFLHTFPT